jgi:DNA sulfur modification protein DndD
MKISRIEITNFRQHRAVKLDLSSSRGDFAVIRGLNGTGKTNLLKAITWGVTGDLGRSEPKHNPTSLVSFGAISSYEPGSRIPVAVKLELELGQNLGAEILRHSYFRIEGDSVVSAGSELIVRTHQPGTGWHKEPEPDLWIDGHLPRRFSHYFLFDGEQLEKFFKEAEAKYVRDAVMEIAQIDHLERMVGRLQITEGDLTKAVAHQGKGESGSELEARYKELEEKERLLKERLEQKRLEKAENENAIDNARSQMGDVQAIQSELRRLDALQSAADSAQQRAITASNDFYLWTTEIAPYMVLFGSVAALENEIEDARSRKVLPPAYDPDSLRELLKTGTCVCGRSLASGEDGHSHIERLVEEFAALSEVGEALRNVEGPLSRLRGRFFDQRTKGEALGKTRQAASQEAKEADAKVAALKKGLGEHDDQKIAIIGQALDRAMEAAKSIERDLVNYERDLDDTRRERVKLQTEIELAGSKDAKVKVKLKELAFAKEVLRHAQILFDQLKDQVRNSVALNLDEKFQSMIWKKNAFEPVQIDDDYRVQVINKQGFQNREGLSAGETACLAFAFALTLSRVAGVKYPMVVDSPLGRLSGEVKQSVAEVLSNFLVGETGEETAQLLMLVTDEEYDETVEKVLATRDPLVFDIHFDQETGEASLKEAMDG